MALVGNPNVGKTTIFNSITGSWKQVGNWPGVTVDKVIGRKRHHGVDLEVVDLPGTYSLDAYSADEAVARDYITRERPDVVIQVVDSTNLERNLYLTVQLIETGVRLVLALNMYDQVQKRGGRIYTDRLENILEVPIVKTVGNRGTGINHLFYHMISEAHIASKHRHRVTYSDRIEDLVKSLSNVLSEDRGLYVNMDMGHLYHRPRPMRRNPLLRWFSLRLLVGDREALDDIVSADVRKRVERILECTDPDDMELSISDRRYELVKYIVGRVHRGKRKTASPSDMIDGVLTSRWFGIPIFLLVVWAMFELTFRFASPFVTIIQLGTGAAGDLAMDIVPVGWLASLIGEGVIPGVGGVLSFLPNIFVLFLVISLLEASGYMARAAFVMDKLMYRLGLPGRSFIPMMIGFGCNVPAIMATRTIEDKKDRLITILINPFISCSARLPVFVLLAGAFFGRNAGFVVFLLYLGGIVIAVVSAKLFRETIIKGEPAPFIMELPPYRVPTFRTTFRQTWSRGSEYIKKAGTVILAGSIVIWALASFPWGVEYGGEESLAADLGKTLEPVIEPLGFDWRIGVSLVFGFIAKEVVIGSLGVLFGEEDGGGGLEDDLRGDEVFTPLSSLSLMVFVLIYTPCLATLAVIRKETRSVKWTAFSVIYSLSLAWTLSFVIYQGGMLIGL